MSVHRKQGILQVEYEPKWNRQIEGVEKVLAMQGPYGHTVTYQYKPGIYVESF